MASISRLTLVEGPAIVVFGGKTYYTRDAITLNPGISTFDVSDTAHGVMDTRIEDIVGKITFRPVGVWGNIHPLYSVFEDPVIGSSLLGGSDADAVIHSLDGRKITCHGAGVTKLPDLTFSAVEQIPGQVEITFLGTNNTEWSNASKRLVEAAQAFSDTGYDPATVLTQPYAVTLGSGNSALSLETEAGVTVSFEIGAEPRKTDSYGTVDIRLSSFKVSAKFRPVGMSAADYLALFPMQGTGVVRGVSMGGAGKPLVISGTGVYFALNGAAPADGSVVFNAGENRVGELTLQAVRTYASSALKPIFALGTAAPSAS